MSYFDVFNGDADGICALQQLRLADPVASVLVTGVKRDISLLRRVDAAAGDEVTVLDVSMDKNRDALVDLLDKGVRIHYFDHHFAGDIPDHPGLAASIDTSPDVCTSLLVNDYLDGAYRPWAVTAAFGDNLDQSARKAAEPLGLSEDQLCRLKELGIYINYNAYGGSIADLYFAPDELCRRLNPYVDPFAFIYEDETFQDLQAGYAQDMAKTEALRPERATERTALYVLPAEPWARRVSGVFANQLAQAHPDRAHALLTRLPEGDFVVSVRAPMTNKTGADELCRQFPTGGGRKAAAGVNQLPDEMFDEFAFSFAQTYD